MGDLGHEWLLRTDPKQEGEHAGWQRQLLGHGLVYLRYLELGKYDSIWAGVVLRTLDCRRNFPAACGNALGATFYRRMSGSTAWK